MVCFGLRVRVHDGYSTGHVHHGPPRRGPPPHYAPPPRYAPPPHHAPPPQFHHPHGHYI